MPHSYLAVSLIRLVKFSTLCFVPSRSLCYQAKEDGQQERLKHKLKKINILRTYPRFSVCIAKSITVGNDPPSWLLYLWQVYGVVWFEAQHTRRRERNPFYGLQTLPSDWRAAVPGCAAPGWTAPGRGIQRTRVMLIVAKERRKKPLEKKNEWKGKQRSGRSAPQTPDRHQHTY